MAVISLISYELMERLLFFFFFFFFVKSSFRVTSPFHRSSSITVTILKKIVRNEIQGVSSVVIIIITIDWFLFLSQCYRLITHLNYP